MDGRPDGKLNCGRGRALAALAKATIDAVEYFMSEDWFGQRCKAKVEFGDEEINQKVEAKVSAQHKERRIE